MDQFNFSSNVPTAFTRRAFLGVGGSGLLLASAAATIPAFLARSAMGMASPLGLSSLAGVPQDRVLVVIQLAGGNDGLNTVVPFGDAAYYRARPTIGIPSAVTGRGPRQTAVGVAPVRPSIHAAPARVIASTRR